MRFAFVLALVALTAGAERPERYGGRDMRSGGRGGVGTTPTYLEFAPSSGAGLPVISHHNTALCDALAAEVPTWSAAVDGGAGNWCLGGDGLAVGGSQVTFATFGSPTVIDTPVCPSGLDCLAATGQPVKALQTGTGQGSAATAAVASGTGAMTACWWGQLNATMAGSDFPILAHATSTAAGSMPWELDHYLGKFRIAMVDGAGNYSVSEATGDPNSVTFFCGSHAGGTGVARGYLNGTAATAGASMTRASETYKPTLHGYNGTSDGAVGQTSFGAFYVDKELTPTQIAAISRRVLADVPKAVIRGGASYVDMTYSRTGSRFCARADNTGSIVPANRPCISQSGYLSEAAGTNLVLRSQELTTGPWNTAYVTATTNYGFAPDGTETAERIIGGGSAALFQTGLSIPAPATLSIFVKGTSGSGTVCPYLYNGSMPDSDATACNYNPTAWTRCVTVSNNPTNIEIGLSNTAFAGCTPTAGYDILAWGAQVETGSVATSYIPTTSAAASRGVDLGYFTHGQSTYATGCLATTQDWIAPASSNGGPLALTAGVSTYKQAIIYFSGLKGYVGGAPQVTVTAPTASGSSRYVYSWGPNGTSLVAGANSATGTAGTPATTDRLNIGTYDGSGTTAQPGRYSRIQYDPRSTRCR